MLQQWLEQIEFARIWVLPFLLMLPVLAWIRSRNKRKKSTLRVTTAATFTRRTGRNAWVHFPYWLRLFALACLILAIARPRLRFVQNKTRGEGIDIILCMDVSGSMLARDFVPNRLVVARQMAADFVQSRPVDQIGLVIFAGEPYTQFPLSTDHAALLEQVRGINPGMLQDGTVIGEGLAKAVERLSSSKGRSKVVILLTDGNEQPPATRILDPEAALNIAKSKDVKVYTIGMGAPGVATTVEEGVRRTGNATFLDETLLKRIANGTGGAYFRATNNQSLQNIYDQIDRLEKSEVEVITRERFDELFIWCVLAGMFFLLLEIILRYTLFRTFP